MVWMMGLYDLALISGVLAFTPEAIAQDSSWDISQSQNCVRHVGFCKGAWPFSTPIVGDRFVHNPNLKQSESDLPLPPRNPESSSAGGRRDRNLCPQDTVGPTPSPVLTALSPVSKPGLTLADDPTFWVYVPPTSALTAEFSLRTLDDQGIYRTTLVLDDIPGLVSVTLPADAPSLEVGTSYIWSFNLVCDPSNRLEDPFVTGNIQRRELEGDRSIQPDQLPLAEQVAFYGEQGFWYDALSALMELQRTQPTDPRLDEFWRDLLRLGGLEQLEGIE